MLNKQFFLFLKEKDQQLVEATKHSTIINNNQQYNNIQVIVHPLLILSQPQHIDGVYRINCKTQDVISIDNFCSVRTPDLPFKFSRTVIFI